MISMRCNVKLATNPAFSLYTSKTTQKPSSFGRSQDLPEACFLVDRSTAFYTRKLQTVSMDAVAIIKVCFTCGFVCVP